MLTVLGSPRRFCDGVSRRDALKAGSLSLLGSFFGLPALSEIQAAQRSRLGNAENVILLFLHGGAATQDMWDLKPDAPVGVRGEFKPIATNVPGIRICEHLPQMARWMHRTALVRSVNHRAGCHNVVPAFTGFPELVAEQNIANPNHPPSMGSVCAYLKAARRATTARLRLHALLSRLGRGGPAAWHLRRLPRPALRSALRRVPSLLRRRRARATGQAGHHPRRTAAAQRHLAAGLTLDRLAAAPGLLQQVDQQRAA